MILIDSSPISIRHSSGFVSAGAHRPVADSVASFLYVQRCLFDVVICCF
jgi:hypothetical protein